MGSGPQPSVQNSGQSRHGSGSRDKELAGEIFKAYPNGDQYQGQWAGNQPHGWGTFKWADGSVYEGEWLKGKRHGKGEWTKPSGAVYRGEWVGGVMQGVGCYRGPDNSFYTGNWAAGMKQGLGRKQYPNGDVYEGFWKSDAAEGVGRYVWANGKEYWGDWKGGTMFGIGTLVWASGDSYYGEWEAGFEHGSGEFSGADGSRFEGTWSRGLRDGTGIYYPKDYRKQSTQSPSPSGKVTTTPLARHGGLEGAKVAPDEKEGNVEVEGRVGEAENVEDEERETLEGDALASKLTWPGVDGDGGRREKRGSGLEEFRNLVDKLLSEGAKELGARLDRQDSLWVSSLAPKPDFRSGPLLGKTVGLDEEEGEGSNGRRRFMQKRGTSVELVTGMETKSPEVVRQGHREGKEKDLNASEEVTRNVAAEFIRRLNEIRVEKVTRVWRSANAVEHSNEEISLDSNGRKGADEEIVTTDHNRGLSRQASSLPDLQSEDSLRSTPSTSEVSSPKVPLAPGRDEGQEGWEDVGQAPNAVMRNVMDGAAGSTTSLSSLDFETSEHREGEAIDQNGAGDYDRDEDIYLNKKQLKEADLGQQSVVGVYEPVRQLLPVSEEGSWEHTPKGRQPSRTTSVGMLGTGSSEMSWGGDEFVRKHLTREGEGGMGLPSGPRKAMLRGSMSDIGSVRRFSDGGEGGLRGGSDQGLTGSIFSGPMFSHAGPPAVAIEPGVPLIREYVQGSLVSETPKDAKGASLPKRKGLRGEGKRAGETIFKGHRSYDLMLTLQLGIRYAVGRMTREPLRELQDSDFSTATTTVRFPPEGTQQTPSHSMQPFRWKDFCPQVFRRLRSMFGIDPSDYMLSLCGDDALRELSSPGKSGSVFYLSHDDRFIIKTMRKAEVSALLRMLPAYYRHVQDYANTLLTKFFGLHQVKIHHGSKVRFVVMGNLLQSEHRIHRRFDLKGSSHGRSTDKVEIDETTTLKDLDLDLAFQLFPFQRKVLQDQIVADCRFLEEQRIMDYSLLLGLHFKAKPPPPPVVLISDGPTGSVEKGLLNPAVTEDGILKAGSSVDESSNGPTSTQVARDAAVSSERSKEETFNPLSQRPRGTLGQGMEATAVRLDRRDRKPITDPELAEAYQVVLYFGIIDILQEYDKWKRMEHYVKKLQYDGKSISAVAPKLYAKRFQDFVLATFLELT